MLPFLPNCRPARLAAACAQWVTAGVALAMAGPLCAQEAPSWNLSGFGSLGAIYQSGGAGGGFLRNSVQEGADASFSATEDSRLGLQLNWNGGPRWSGAVQAVALERPSAARPAESVEWAYLAYRPRPDSQIRLGRTNPDMFLYADSRNVGYALPWARPPVDFYGFAPAAAVDGLDLEQRWPSDDAQWRARLTVGQISSTGSDSRGQALALRGRDIVSLGSSREEGGLMVKASYERGRIAMGMPAGLAELRDGLAQLAALPVPGLAESIEPLRQGLWTGGPVRYLALGAQYDRGPWSLITEASDLEAPHSPLSGRRAYASLSHRSGSVSVYGLASRVRPKKPAPAVPDLATTLAPMVGAQAAAQAQMLASYAGAAVAQYRYDQNTVGAGLRWDCATNASLKLQVDRFHVHANGAAGWRRSDGQAMRGTLYSLVFDFVWGQ